MWWGRREKERVGKGGIRKNEKKEDCRKGEGKGRLKEVTAFEEINRHGCQC